MNQEISDLLQKALSESIDNYSVILDEKNLPGEGYHGDIIRLSLKNKKSKLVINLIIKQSTFDTALINNVFKTEIYFYEVIWPKFKAFQNIFAPGLEGMNIPPQCLATNSQTDKKRLILENLKFSNYKILDRPESFDKQHMELVFKTYAKMHGLSFAFKEKNPEEYKNIIMPHDNAIESLEKLRFTFKRIATRSNHILQHYQGEHAAEIKNKMSDYATNIEKVFNENFFYAEEYSVVIHGDCWSNNMLFKYDEFQNPVDLKLIDFQHSRIASPVHDLVHAFYCGASKKLLDDLEHYLTTYYESLTKVLEEFGCDSGKLYPFKELKREWRRYAKMGFALAILMWVAKLVTNDHTTIGKNEIDDRSHLVGSYDQETYDKIINNIALHMYNNQFF